tara:strand:+ start:1937 stop:2257 length:321 start_codon:yes stop_codon:yes gene_type:complete
MIPLLFYISTNKDKTDDKYFGLLGGLTLMIPLAIKPIKKYNLKNLKYIIPYFYQIPVILYVSYYGKESKMFIFKTLKGFAILQILFNLYFIYLYYRSKNDKNNKKK